MQQRRCTRTETSHRRSRTHRVILTLARKQTRRNPDQQHRPDRIDPHGRLTIRYRSRHPDGFRSRTRIPGRCRCRRTHQRRKGSAYRHPDRFGLRSKQGPFGRIHESVGCSPIRHSGRRVALLHVPLLDALHDAGLCRQRRGDDRARPSQSERFLCRRTDPRSEIPVVRRHAPHTDRTRHDSG